MAEAMKDSGQEWIGAIPESWEVKRIAALYSPRNTKVSDEDYPPLSVTMQGVLPQLETVAKTDDHSNRKLVKKGDFAINSRSDRRGSCGISQYDGSVSLINTVLKPAAKMNPAYYNWFFHTTLFADEFYKWGHGIVDDLWSTNWQDMKSICVTVPPLDEQEKIADFLDEKCAEIDQLSEDIQKQIDILEEYKKSVITRAVTKGLDPNAEMKDSEDERIGTIPSDWDVKKLKYITRESYENGLMIPENDKYIGMENVLSYSNDFYETETEYEVSFQKRCRKGSVLFGKLRPYLAKVIICPFTGFATGEFMQLTNFDGDSRYLRYSLLNRTFIESVNMSTYGAKMPRANSEYINNLKICIPPKDEQCKIADFLDSACSEIDESIQSQQRQLSNLESYKKSIIYEYVTGKKRVA